MFTWFSHYKTWSDGDMRPGRSLDVAALPPDRRPARRFRVQPTLFGVVAIVGLVLFLLIAPEVADPGMAGFVWAALLGLVVVGVIWPCVAVLTVRVEPMVDTGTPLRPVRVGEPTTLRLRIGNRLAEVALRWVDGDTAVPVGAGPTVDVSVPMTTVRRGRFHRLSVRVISDAPFGIATASRAVTIDLPRPLEVGPRPIDVDHLADPDSDDPVARESSRLWCAAVTGAQTTLDPKQMKEWTPNSRYGGHAFGLGNFEQFLEKRDTVLPWIEGYSPYALVTKDDPPVYLIYSAPPALGQDQKDPTHTSNFGVKLQEHCAETGVDCELVYPGAPEVKYQNPTDFLIAKLKASASK